MLREMNLRLERLTEMLDRNFIDLVQFESDGCNLTSCMFFKDFYKILVKGVLVCLILKNGFIPIHNYSELLECYLTSNYMIIFRNISD